MNNINMSTREAVQRLKGEKWVPIPNYEGWYEVSSLGRVKRVKTGPGVKSAGRILKPYISRGGYKCLALCRNGIIKKFETHRLVGLAFIGEMPMGSVTNHKDGIKTNDYPENLEYVTQSQNMYHAHRIGLCPVPYGEKHYWSKLNGKQVSEIKQLFRETKLSHRVIGLKFGVHTATVQAIKEGRSWKQTK